MSKKVKNIVIAAALILVLFAAYNYFFVDDNASDSLVTSSAPNNLDREILVLLGELKAIQLDGTFLQSPMLASLQDFHVQLEPQPVGRSNPYAPPGTDAPLSPTRQAPAAATAVEESPTSTAPQELPGTTEEF